MFKNSNDHNKRFINNISIYIDMKNNLNLFKALGEETKNEILKTLIDGELCACEIPDKIKKTQSNTSMHLLKLADWGLVKSRRDGKKIIYSLNNPKIKKAFKLLGEDKK